jgi:ABC-type Mn2+/Zn2+ transport system permease subunit
MSIFIIVFISVINYLTKEHQFKTDGQFELVYGVYLALGILSHWLKGAHIRG